MKCCLCSKTLYHPVSIDRGFGDTCWSIQQYQTIIDQVSKKNPHISWVRKPISEKDRFYHHYPKPVVKHVWEELNKHLMCEEDLTNHLTLISQKAGGFLLQQVEDRIKSPESIAAKTQRLWNPRLKKTSIPITDIIRYTIITESDSIARIVQDVGEKLVESGHTITRLEHSYNSTMYKDLKLVFKTRDKVYGEIQFHTPETYSKKQESHTYYKESQKAGSVEEMNRFLNLSSKVWENTFTPPNINNIRIRNTCMVDRRR